MKSKFYHSKKFSSVLFITIIALTFVLAVTISIQTGNKNNNDSSTILDEAVPVKPLEQPCPKESGIYYESTEGYAGGVYVSGDYAYVADEYSGLAVINISDPTNPETIAYEDTGGTALGIFVSGNYAYVADGYSGLEVIDVSNPTNPGTPVREDTAGLSFNVYVNGHYAYLADGSGLAVIDVSNPANPALPVYEPTPGDAMDVYVNGNYAYIADYFGGLTVIDVSNPANPAFITNKSTTGAAAGVYVSGDYAYVADMYSGLAIINISDPTHPGTPIYEDTTGTPERVYVSGDYAYVADRNNGIAIINISDPTHPEAPIYIDTADSALDVYVRGDFAYVADMSGLAVIGGPPQNFVIYSPTTWVLDQTPTVICQFSEFISGIDVSTVQYAYSTAGSSTPSIWAAVDGVYEDAACINSAEDYDKSTLYARVLAVPFGQDSKTLNTIRFRATDMANSIGTQNPATAIRIDSTAPGSFSIYSPTNWAINQSPTVICQFYTSTSGVDVSTVQYAYSTSGSLTPTNWAAVDGVYEGSACTAIAEDNDTGTLYACIMAVPFGQSSDILNTIRFRANDMVGNIGVQTTATIIRVDTSPVDAFELYSPKDTITDPTPTIIIDFTCDISGINISSVEYAYSITGNLIPTNWAKVDGVYTDSSCTKVAVDGTSGILYAKKITVPFNQYSEVNNTIRLRASDMAGNVNQSIAFLVKIVSPPDSDNDDDDNDKNDDKSTRKAWYINPLCIIIAGAIVGAVFLGIVLLVKRSKRAKIDKKFVRRYAQENIAQITVDKIEKDKVMIKLTKTKTIEFDEEPEEHLEPIKEHVVNSTEQKEIVERPVAPKSKLVALEEFKVQISEYVRKEDHDILYNQINNLNDMIQQLEVSFKANLVNQNAYVEQKAQYKAHLMNLTEKFETASKELEVEIKKDLFATKESIGFVWVKRIEDSAEIYELNTGKIKLRIDELRDINKYLHEQKLTSGMVKRIGLTVNDQKLYVLAVFGMVLSKVFLIITRNPGQILDVTLKQFSDDLDANFEQVLRNPAIIQSKIAQLLFQGL